MVDSAAISESLLGEGVQADATGILETFTDAETYDASEEEKHLLATLQARFEESAQHRRSKDDEIMTNYNVLKGGVLPARHLDTGESIFITLTETSRQDWAEYISTDNITRNINRGLVGKHTRVVPAVEVTPASDDESDVASAKVATSALEALARTISLRDKWVKSHRFGVGWAGTGIIESFWDKEAGRKVAWCEKCNYTGNLRKVGQPCPRCSIKNEQVAQAQTTQQAQELYQQVSANPEMAAQDPSMMQMDPVQAQPAPTLEAIQEGDIGAKVHDPRNFYPEPGVDEIVDMRYACVAEAVPLSKVAGMFPPMAKYLTPETTPELPHLVVKRTAIQDRVLLYQWHVRPSNKHPEGRLIYVCNDMVMNQSDGEPDEEGNPTKILGEPHPYNELPTLPFYPIRWERTEGEFWGESHITQSKWQQWDRDDLLRDMREQRRLTIHPPLLAPIGSMISQEDFYDLPPNSVVKYNAGTSIRPDWLSPPEFASYVYEELERMRQSCMASASVTDQEMGITSGDPSGRYAAILEAQSAESLRPIMVVNSTAWMEMHRGFIILMQKYYSRDKIWTIRGKDQWMSYSWGAAELKEGWDIALVETDSLSKNPALRLEQTERLFDRGYFADQQTGMQDMDYFGRMAGIQDAKRGPDSDANMRIYAKAIPELVMRGKFPGFMPWDSAQICAEEIAGWLRGAGRKQPPDVQMQVGMVWQGYAITYMQSQMAQGLPVDANVLPTQGYPKQEGPPQGQPQGGPQSNNVPGNPAQEASGIVRQADQTGENLASGGPHEG